MILVGALADIPLGEAIRVMDDVPIAVFRVPLGDSDGATDHGDGSVVYAIDDTCSHQKASLADGWVEDCRVECPLHAAWFDLRTGEPDGLPAKAPVRTHQVVVLDGMVYVRPSDRSSATSVRDADVA